MDVPDASVTRILTSLGFVVTNSANGWDVTPPTRRFDWLSPVTSAAPT